MKEPAAPVPGGAASRRIHRVAAIAACVVFFYWAPMTSSSASIQGDTANVHYPMQRYFSDRLSPRQLPFWTPYVLSGYPLLANPEVGAWYPPNWPFLLAGVTPRSIQLELALNAFLACLGAYLLISKHVENRMAAILGAFAYGLSGFFAGHASHVSLFAAAAMFPWLLVAYRRAIDIAPIRYTAFGGLVGATLILAGSGQAAVCSFVGLGLYAFADWWRERQGWLRNVAIIGFMLAGALACAAIQLLPAQELAGYSSRAADSSTIVEGILHPGSLMTLVAPDWLGAISGAAKDYRVLRSFTSTPACWFCRWQRSAPSRAECGCRGCSSSCYLCGTCWDPPAVCTTWERWLPACTDSVRPSRAGSWPHWGWRCWRRRVASGFLRAGAFLTCQSLWPAFCSWMSGIGTRSETRWLMPTPVSMNSTARAKRPAASAWP